jgi:hypothetical protein
MTGHVAGDDPHQGAAVGRGEQRHLVAGQVLVARLNPLLGAGQVDPQLQAVEQAAAHDEVLGRGLDVQDPLPGRHPLRPAVADEPAAAHRVVVLQKAVHHVGHGLEAAVRVPGRALRLARSVVDLAHLVQVDEWVEVGQVGTGERAEDREALTLEAARCRRDRTHRALCRDRWVRRRDAGQHGDVVDGDSGHGDS